MNNRTCCFTGHRTISQTEVETVVRNLNVEVRKAIENGVNTFVCGGALGFDMIAANLIICLKQMGEFVRLVLVLPCKDQERHWNEKQRENYRHILSSAEEITYITEQYHDGCMKKRNQKMIALSDLCITYLRDKNSGTAQTVRMAKNKGIPVVKL